MTDTPRIGDTVHYRSHGSPVLPDGTRTYYPVCNAAIVTGYDGPNHLRVIVLSDTGHHHNTIERDTNTVTRVEEDGHVYSANFTPGTWHHIH